MSVETYIARKLNPWATFFILAFSLSLKATKHIGVRHVDEVRCIVKCDPYQMSF